MQKISKCIGSGKAGRLELPVTPLFDRFDSENGKLHTHERNSMGTRWCHRTQCQARISSVVSIWSCIFFNYTHVQGMLATSQYFFWESQSLCESTSMRTPVPSMSVCTNNDNHRWLEWSPGFTFNSQSFSLWLRKTRWFRPIWDKTLLCKCVRKCGGRWLCGFRIKTKINFCPIFLALTVQNTVIRARVDLNCHLWTCPELLWIATFCCTLLLIPYNLIIRRYYFVFPPCASAFVLK